MTDAGNDRAALDRLCDRLRSASEARLTRPDQGLGGESVAEVVHQTSTWAASSQGAPVAVPRLHPLASGDQLAVVGREFLDWVSSADDREAAHREWRALIEHLRVVI